MIDLPTALRGRPGAFLILAAGLVLGLGLLGQATATYLEARTQIAESRALLGRTRAAAARIEPPAPLSGADETALLAAFRARLDGLGGGRAVILDETTLQADAARPSAPRLVARLRGTAEGLHGLLLALETAAPLMVVEAADLTVLRAADAEAGWPTVMGLSLTARGAVLSARAATVERP